MARALFVLLATILLAAEGQLAHSAGMDGGGLFIDRLPASLAGTWEISVSDPALGIDGLDSVAWRPIRVPGTWQSQGIPEHGTVWYRLRFELDPSVSTIALAIVFDEIRDADEVYLDGQLVGRTGGFPPNYDKASDFARIYQLPASLSVRQAPHWLAIRVHNPGPSSGGLTTPPILDSVARAFMHKTRAELPLALLSAALASLGLFALFFFLRDRTQPDALFYFLATSAAALGLVSSLSIWVFSNLPLSTLFRSHTSAAFLVPALYALFFLRFFERPLRRHHQILVLFQLAGALVCWFWPRVDDISFILPAGFLAGALIFADAVLLLVQDVRRRAPWSRVLLCVSVLVLGASLHDGVARLPAFEGAASRFAYFPPAFFLLMTAYLPAMADRFALLRHQASTDPLTGLANRVVLFDRINLELARARRSGSPAALALLDLDHFKKFNDRFGHLAGDRLLMATAKSMVVNTRETDLAARFGGEEFAILLPEVNEQQAILCLERVRLTVSTLRVSGVPDGITASIGVAVFDPAVRTSISVTAWLRQADAALYRAKAGGRNQIVLAEGDPPISSASGGLPVINPFRKKSSAEVKKVDG
jgi:diguanylate cyclase (GGDEF)-like protein